ncbi:MAG: DegT/DnrJ/EryC1/StrS family aminotransferase, partial [Planctomycetota bacterium]
NNCDISWFVFVVRLAGTFTLQQRDRVLEAMTARGIQVKDYFPPVLLQPFMAEQSGYKQGDFPVTESVCKSTISLPFYNNLTRDEVVIVCKELKEALDKI